MCSRESLSHPKFDAVLGVLVLDDGPHLQVVFEGAGDVVGRLAGLDAALDAGAHLLLAENADQRPPRRLKVLVTLGEDLRKLQSLTGMLEILVMGSIFSTSPMETSGIQRAQLTWAHLVPVLVLFMAPPLLGQSSQGGLMPSVQVRQSQEPLGMVVIP